MLVEGLPGLGEPADLEDVGAQGGRHIGQVLGIGGGGDPLDAGGQDGLVLAGGALGVLLPQRVGEE